MYRCHKLREHEGLQTTLPFSFEYHVTPRKYVWQDNTRHPKLLGRCSYK